MNLKERVYEHILKLNDLTTYPKESSLIFRASEVGDCKKVLFYRKMNVKPEEGYTSDEDKARVLLLLRDGNRHGDSIIDIVKQLPNVEATSMEQGRTLTYTTLKGRTIYITGHPDAVVHDIEEGKKFVLEIKGISTYYCKNLEDENLNQLKAIYPTGYKAIPQLRIYMEMFDADYGMIILKDKNTSAWYQFTIDKDENRFANLMKKLGSVSDACLEQKPPECDFLEGDKRCKYCPYPEYCGRK